MLSKERKSWGEREKEREDERARVCEKIIFLNLCFAFQFFFFFRLSFFLFWFLGERERKTRFLFTNHLNAFQLSQPPPRPPSFLPSFPLQPRNQNKNGFRCRCPRCPRGPPRPQGSPLVGRRLGAPRRLCSRCGGGGHVVGRDRCCRGAFFLVDFFLFFLVSSLAPLEICSFRSNDRDIF